MVSPLQRRRARLAQGAPARSPMQSTATRASSRIEWDLVRSTIDADLRQLKAIKPMAGKLEYKNKVLMSYTPYLDAPDMPIDIKVILMVWLFDIGSMAKALEIARVAIDGDYPMPDFINQAPAEFVADTVLAWTERHFKNGQAIEPYFSQVFTWVTQEFNTYEVVVAKYYKLAGLIALGQYNVQPKHVADPQRLKTALTMFEKADELYDSIGVGTRIAQVKKRLAALEPVD